jgi:bifunctional non-homologous end joining protein LigD
MARSNTGAEPPVRVAGIAITHGEKILWPQTARSKSVRKADLARYYEIVAPRMLPHIVRRPLSMVRAPDGIAGERFFQRHAIPGIGAGLPISVAGEKKPFFALDSAEDLGALAQAAVLEIHPWGCKPGDPETPERVIFDLDPAPERPFVRTIEAAQEVREALSLCG